MLVPKHVIALGKIAARTSDRYAVTAIRVERHQGQPRAIATDGLRAVIFTWQEPDASQFPAIDGLSSKPVPQFGVNIPPKALADAARGISRRLIKPILGHLLLDESNRDTVHLASTTLDNITRAQAKADEAVFPPVDDVLPHPGRDGTAYDPKRHGEVAFTHVRIGVNAKLLAQTLEALADLAAEDANHTVVLTVPIRGNSPLRLDARCPERQAVAAAIPVSVDLAHHADQPAAPQPIAKPRKTRAGVAAAAA